MKSKYPGGTRASGYTVQLHPAPTPQCESGFYSRYKHGKSRRARVCLLCACVISLCGEVKPLFSRKCFYFSSSLSLRLGSLGTAECAFCLGSRRDCACARAQTHTRARRAVCVAACVSLRRVSVLMPLSLSRCFVVDGFPERAYGKWNDVLAEDAGPRKANATFILYKCCCVQSNKSLALPYISKQISFTEVTKPDKFKVSFSLSGPAQLPHNTPPHTHTQSVSMNTLQTKELWHIIHSYICVVHFIQ